MGSKAVLSRARTKVRLVSFNETISEGYVFLAHEQRVSDLLNDNRDFLPLETDAGEMRVISKRAIMELEILNVDSKEDAKEPEGAIPLLSGNAYDVLGAPRDADEATVREFYRQKIESVSKENIFGFTDNRDLIRAAAALRKRYIAAYEAITNTNRIEAIGEAIKAARPKKTVQSR